MLAKRKILVAGMALVGLAIFAGCTTQTARTVVPATPVTTPSGSRVTSTVTYNLTMRDFSFSFNQIDATPGQTIVVNVTNSNGEHDFVIDEFGVNTGLMTSGQIQTVTFKIPDNAPLGTTYEFYCSVNDHRAMGMSGFIVVKDL